MGEVAALRPSNATPDADVKLGTDLKRLRELIHERSFGCGEIVKLSSGTESNFYFNMKPTMLHPEGALLLGKLIAHRLHDKGVDFVGGLELGAVPIVSVTAAESQKVGRSIHGFIVRKKPKEHGARLLVEGLSADENLKGRAVAVIDDVCTTGESVLKAVGAAQEAGATVALVLALVDREEGAARLMAERELPFEALFKASEFIPAGFERLPPAS